jgi:hypothetical protein
LNACGSPEHEFLASAGLAVTARLSPWERSRETYDSTERRGEFDDLLEHRYFVDLFTQSKVLFTELVSGARAIRGVTGDPA